jgi:hypothetical protein
MENSNQKTITYIGAVLIALLLLGLVFALVRNSKEKNNLRSEKLNSERLFSEKSAVQSELDRLKNDFSVLKEQSDSSVQLLNNTEAKLTEAERRLRTLSGQYAAKSKEASEEYQRQKEALEKEYSELKSSYDNLMSQNGDLQSRLASMQAQTNDLAEKLKLMDTFDSDNFQVYGSRGKNDRPVVCARRVKKININFEVPQSLAEAISFNIVTPSGTTISSDDKSLSWIFPVDVRDLTASLSPVSAEFEQSKRVTLTYAPKEKLNSGEYKIQIMSDNKNIGNCRIILR